MQVIPVVRAVAEMRSRVADLRKRGKRVAVVPTMGALHEGHLSLVRMAKAVADEVVLTIFVNPMQFAAGEDLQTYPRTEARDVELAAGAGATVAFCPSLGAMYPAGFQTQVVPGDLSLPMCGASREGHFVGVCTVVSKIFHITSPDVAVFGQKDYQQLAVIRRMVLDLDFDIEIVAAPIVREADGLAMSSRNTYLSAAQRAQAVSLSRGLERAREKFAAGERSAAALAHTVRSTIENQAPNGNIEYIDVRDAGSLENLTELSQPAVLALAVRFGKTRLIDNCVLE